MKISVAMATYNGERFLRAQLDSLAAQRRPPDELVVVDDGSFDSTTEILEQFACSAAFPVQIHRNERNLGSSDNFLKAVALCTGDWISLCDQDDVWSPEKLAIIEQRIRACPRPDIVLWTHSAQVVDEQLSPSGVIYPNFARFHLMQGSALPIWWFAPGFSLVFRADLLKIACRLASERGPDPSDPSVSMAHDRYICFIASSLGSIGLLPERLVLYRRHDRTTTTTFRGGNRHVKSSARIRSAIARVLCADNADTYSQHSRAAAKIAVVFKRNSENEPLPALRNQLEHAHNRHIAYSTWLAERSKIYSDSGLLVRVSAFLRATRSIGYVRFYGSARLLALRAFFKDMLFSAVGPTRIRRMIANRLDA